MTANEKLNAIGSMRAAMRKRTDGDALANLSARELDVEYANTSKEYDRWAASEAARATQYNVARQRN